MHLHSFSNIYKNIHNGEQIIAFDTRSSSLAAKKRLLFAFYCQFAHVRFGFGQIEIHSENLVEQNIFLQYFPSF